MAVAVHVPSGWMVVDGGRALDPSGWRDDGGREGRRDRYVHLESGLMLESLVEGNMILAGILAFIWDPFNTVLGFRFWVLGSMHTISVAMVTATRHLAPTPRSPNTHHRTPIT